MSMTKWVTDERRFGGCFGYCLLWGCSATHGVACGLLISATETTSSSHEVPAPQRQ